MNEVYAALAKVQAELPGLKKSATNPHFKSKYIPLEDIVEAADPVLAAHGLLFYAAPTVLDTDTPAITYKLVHVETGDSIQDVMPLLLDKRNSQGVGSAITYARRYILTSLLNIIADVDDDGNKASTPAKAATLVEALTEGRSKASFTDQVRATGKKAAEIREWAASEINPKTGAPYSLDDVGVDAKGLTAFLNGLDEEKQAKLLAWAK